MMELEYIPLKTADGNVCGYACNRSGNVTLSLRAHMAGDAHIFTEMGYAAAPVNASIHISGGISAVAVLKAGNLYCTGFGKNNPMSMSALRARLLEVRAQPQRKPEPAKGETLPTPTPPTRTAPPPISEAVKARREEPAQPQQEQGDKLPRQGWNTGAGPSLTEEPQEDVFDPDAAVAQALRRLASTAAEEFLSPLPAEGPESICQEPNEQKGMDPASFAALFTRAEAVFTRANAAPEHPAPTVAAEEPTSGLQRPHPPAKEANGAAPGSGDAKGEQPWFMSYLQEEVGERPAADPPAPRQYSPRDWAGEVDRILGYDPGSSRQTPIQNPFPHIFPEARFVQDAAAREGAHLTGSWHRGGERFRITAILGDYSPEPPAHLRGFTRYIRTRSGGYWVRVEDEP